MGMRLSSVVLLVSCIGLAQDPPAKKAESSCYKDRSVDEYIVELNKRQKGSHNPLPTDICIFAMCTHTGVGPGPAKPAPPGPTTKPSTPSMSSNPSAKPPAGESDESSSKKEAAEVEGTLPTEASSSTYDPVSAARDVDVGDYYFRQKNYRGALMRYADAEKAKPGDAAIHLRMGRGWEKLGAPERAYLEYDAAVKLEPGEGKTASEAKEAMQRLKPELQKAGVDPAALVAENQPEKPCLAPPAAAPSH